MTQTKEQYLKGRWKINGRRLRYEAGLDICLATLQILREYAMDCESPWFACIHGEDLAKVRALIERGEHIQRDDDPEVMSDLPLWKDWLHEVADLLPRLWD